MQFDPNALLGTQNEFPQRPQFLAALTRLYVKVTQDRSKNYLLLHHGEALAWSHRRTDKEKMEKRIRSQNGNKTKRLGEVLEVSFYKYSYLELSFLEESGRGV